MNYIKTLH